MLQMKCVLHRLTIRHACPLRAATGRVCGGVKVKQDLNLSLKVFFHLSLFWTRHGGCGSGGREQVVL